MDKLVFRIPAVALLASGVGLICVTPIAFAVPGLQVLYVLPLAFAAWVVRNRTTVTSEQVVARGVFGKKTVAWTDVKAVKLSEKSWLSLVLTDDELVKMPAVRLMHLPALAAVSGGRITVPAVEAEAAPAEETAGEVAEVEGAEVEGAAVEVTGAEVAEAGGAAEPAEDPAPEAGRTEVTDAERERADRA